MDRRQIKSIIISEDHYNALGVVRSLGVVGTEVYLILTTQEKTYVDSSKYVSKTLKIEHTKEAVLKAIEGIISRENETFVLFPLSDFSAQIVDEEFINFPSNVIAPNACGVMNKLSDKYFIKEIAKNCGLDVPQGVVVSFEKDIEVKWDVFPAILKPLVSVEGTKSDIAIVGSYEELIDVSKSYRAKGYSRALLEEYIDGENAHMIEVMGGRNFDGTVDFAGIISKIREFPICNGSTSYATIVKEHDGIDLDKLSTFLAETGFVGLFDFEFKYSGKKAYFIECNYRHGAPGFVFTKCGINIPVCWIDKNVNGVLSEKRQLNEDVVFMVEQNDFINMLKGTPKFCSWVNQYRKAVRIFAYKGDMKPVRKYYCQLMKSLIHRVFRSRGKC